MTLHARHTAAAPATVARAGQWLALAALAGLPLPGAILGMALASAAGSGIAILARRLIGGQTGDIAGATQQIGEIALYLGFAVMLGAGR